MSTVTVTEFIEAQDVDVWRPPHRPRRPGRLALRRRRGRRCSPPGPFGAGTAWRETRVAPRRRRAVRGVPRGRGRPPRTGWCSARPGAGVDYRITWTLRTGRAAPTRLHRGHRRAGGRADRPVRPGAGPDPRRPRRPRRSRARCAATWPTWPARSRRRAPDRRSGRAPPECATRAATLTGASDCAATGGRRWVGCRAEVRHGVPEGPAADRGGGRGGARRRGGRRRGRYRVLAPAEVSTVGPGRVPGRGHPAGRGDRPAAGRPR